jgi:hypothetical protein
VNSGRSCQTPSSTVRGGFALLFLTAGLWAAPARAAHDDPEFDQHIRPLLDLYCVSCHGPDDPESGVRLDTIDGRITGATIRDYELLHEVLEYEDMPPKKARSHPTEEERAEFVSWISKSIHAARLLDKERNGLTRRLSRDQYRRTLHDLLGLREDIARILPADAVSKEGFRNNSAALQLSPLQMELYWEIAERALDLCLVDEDIPPAIQRFRIDLGKNKNPDPYRGRLILGAGSKLLSTSHFVLTELDAEKDFDLVPFRMRRDYEFMEGYAGNSTVRGLRTYDDLAHSVFCCFRSAGGYKGKAPAHFIHERGLLLRPTKPADTIFGVTSAFGPPPNFKISLRQLPEYGDFIVRVTASRFPDPMAIEPTDPIAPSDAGLSLAPGDTTLSVTEAGIYQVDATYELGEKSEVINIRVGTYALSLPTAGGSKTLAKTLELDDIADLLFDTIEIHLPGKKRVINLLELELPWEDQNLAQYATITASSTLNSKEDKGQFTWQHLIDGDHKTLAHTRPEDDPWVKLAFDEAVRVDRLIIHNRPGFEGRFDGARLSFLHEGEELHTHTFKGESIDKSAGFALLRLEPGMHETDVPTGNRATLESLALHRLDPENPLAQRFRAYEARSPYLGVHLGFRRDCGSSLSPVGQPQLVTSAEPQTYSFIAAIRDFPTPALAKANPNYLAGMREIAVRSEFVDDADMPRLAIHSIEFEGPYYETWPPKTHTDILDPNDTTPNTRQHAELVLERFLSRAWRRPPTARDQQFALGIYDRARSELGAFRPAIEEALLAILTSPEFLLLVEESASPAAEPLSDFELASKLSYFFTGSAPSADLRARADAGTLRDDLDATIHALIDDPGFDTAIEEFVYQWLQLDKYEVVEINRKKHKALRRHERLQLRREPIEFVQHLVHADLPLANLVQSDILVVNDAVATYYGITNRDSTGLAFAPVTHSDPDRGGLLSMTAILAGLSDGTESNPVKRGAWLARKIIAEPPADPPPNVPDLDATPADGLTLRQQLELHRDTEGCKKCHEGIDPWGIPFESMSAIGLPQTHSDPRSTLPDGTEVADLNALKSYLATDYLDQVAYSFMLHLASYAIGRSLTYSESEELKTQALSLRSDGYRMRSVIHFVATRDFFLMK